MLDLTRIRRTAAGVLGFAIAAAASSAAADADEPAASPAPRLRPHAYALVVGDNTGGSGQATLHFAEDDARRVAAVLRELGHYDASDVRVLIRPDAAHVLGAIDELAARARANADRGEQAEVLFYFSGHARAAALDLGAEELALTTLRDRLRAVASTLTIVVLDACQSGAFSRVKGAEPASDFSYNSVSRLTQRGLAVMASSTAEELSQESDELKASYFTHHLLTGLRGAGDADGDGRVSLDEAYRYAYRRTLAATARTQVGEQHVTLETDLAGQGEVPMTYPAEAKAHLELPSALDGRVLLLHRASGAVIAEIQKAPGSPVRIAVVAGAYDAVVSTKGTAVDCQLALMDDHVTELDVGSCTPVATPRTVPKGAAPDDGSSAMERDADYEPPGSPRSPLRENDRWAIEGSVGLITQQTDGYTDRLGEFGYAQRSPAPLRYALGVSRIVAPHLAVVVQAGALSRDSFERAIADATDRASYRAYGGTVLLRASTELGTCLGLYAQGGGGVGMGVVDVQTQQSGVSPATSTTTYGTVVGGAVGMTARLPHLVTLFAQVGYDHAPVIRNLIGDTHDGGGVSEIVGFRVRLGERQ